MRSLPSCWVREENLNTFSFSLIVAVCKSLRTTNLIPCDTWFLVVNSNRLQLLDFYGYNGRSNSTHAASALTYFLVHDCIFIVDLVSWRNPLYNLPLLQQSLDVLTETKQNPEALIFTKCKWMKFWAAQFCSCTKCHWSRGKIFKIQSKLLLNRIHSSGAISSLAFLKRYILFICWPFIKRNRGIYLINTARIDTSASKGD